MRLGSERVCAPFYSCEVHCSLDQSTSANQLADTSLRLVYRLNTYPFIHLNFLHALCNLVALTPLMERYEAEHGTLTTLAMFMGRAYYFVAGNGE